MDGIEQIQENNGQHRSKELLVAYLSERIHNSDYSVIANEGDYGHNVRLQRCMYHILGAYHSERETHLFENKFIHAKDGPFDKDIKIMSEEYKSEGGTAEDAAQIQFRSLTMNELYKLGDIVYNICSFYTFAELSDDSQVKDSPWAAVKENEIIQMEYYPATDLECMICDNVHNYISSIQSLPPDVYKYMATIDQVENFKLLLKSHHKADSSDNIVV